MKEKYLKKIRQLEELRKRYEQVRNDDNYGSPVKYAHLKAIYGKRIDNPKGCLIVLGHIIKSFKLGEYQLTVHDPIVHTLDDIYHKKIRKIMTKKHKTKKEREELSELQDRYEIWNRRISKINKKIIKDMLVPESKLEAMANKTVDLDDLDGPTEEELKKDVIDEDLLG